LQETVTTYGIQFANTTEILDIQSSGIYVSNISDTGFLPQLIIEPNESLPELENQTDSYNEDYSSLSDSPDTPFESLILNPQVSKIENSNLSLITLKPKPLNEMPSFFLPPSLEDDVLYLLEQYKNDPRYKNAELDETYVAQYEEAQADSLTNESAKLAGSKQIPTIGFDRIGGENALEKIRNLSRGNDIDIDIAILDSGINPHKDLNLYKEVYFKGASPRDNCGHGTHVAGIAAAKDNDIGVVGVAPGAKLWNVKVMDIGFNSKGKIDCLASKSSLIEGLGYVLKHADEIDVVNLSLGSFCDPNFRKACHAPQLQKAIDAVVSKGIMVVVAAGNNGTDSKDWKPANLKNVLTVSNLNDSDGKCGGLGNLTYRGDDDYLANNSNYGVPAQIIAPGVNVISTNKTGGYSIFSGTSQAAPLVTGAIALYKSITPDTAREVIEFDLLNKSVQDYSQCDKESFGYILGGDNDTIPEPLLNIKDLV
jgi:subtilisin family serine protease